MTAHVAAAPVVLLLAALVAACGGEGKAAAPHPGSTLSATLADPDGDGALAAGPGEPLRDRGGRARPGRTLATFAQITDAHVRDEESPARTPFLDRLGGPFTSTFRPQEALSAQVLAATVRAVNRARPQAVFVTGDIVDNAQEDELATALAVLGGGRVDPDSGAPGYEGVQAASQPDPFYYRPANDAPRRRGLLAAAQRPFRAPGLAAPWYPALGNHDLLAQGEVPPTAQIDAVATGGRLVTGLDPRDPAVRAALDRRGSSAEAVRDLLAGGLPGRSQTVAADPRRRLLTPAGLIGRLPRGGQEAVPGRLDYTVDLGRSARALVLDTVDRGGGAAGRIEPAEAAWVRRALAAAGERWIVVFAHTPLERAPGGEAVLRALDAHPRVVAVVSGDRHRNTIAARGRYWLVGTSSLADYPQQARAFRLVATAGGGAALETWMLDHDGRGLAGVARELAFLDAQGGRPQGFAGRPADRNARLHVGAP